MCGICAGIGNENEIRKVVDGLKKLEYRGYDSSGLAYLKNQKIETIKSVGQIKNLEKKLTTEVKSKTVIGHTRWATHGKVSEENAHPHLSQDENFALVHNGIIENFEELKKNELKGFEFHSQTDTEIFVDLISKQKGGILFKLIKASSLVKGSFAVAMLESKSNKIFLAKRNSPLMVAQNENGCMAASDISVFADAFESCYIMDDDEFAVMSGKTISFFDKNGKKINKEKQSISDFDFGDNNLNERYFMLKEIKEEPIVLRKTYFKYITENLFDELNMESIRKFRSFHFVACGTAYHSSLMGARYIQQFFKKECKVSIASEFRYDNQILQKNCLYVFVSQSGETADTIACAKLVKEKGNKVLCVTNVAYCSLNKLADFVLPTFAGKETAVASTKAYIAQIFTLLLFAICLSKKMEVLEVIKRFVFCNETPLLDENLMNNIFRFKKIFYIGRQQDYITSLEASLKLKEIAYLNCLGIAAGELKHGTLALIDESTLVVAISTQKKMKEKMESNIQEVKARGGKILLVSNIIHNLDIDYQIVLPENEEYLMPILSMVPLQIIAMNYAIKLGLNPDKPRNLAKSVTVE